MDKIAVLIPCYNEEKTIEKVVRDAKAALPEAVIYVYNNNSTDRTAELAEKAGAVVRQEYKQGKGNVIRRMFQEVDALCYIMVDGDDTYPMENAREMADLVLERNSDMVVGDRLSSTYFEENKRPFHNMGNSLVRASINALFKSDIRDIMTGYRAFSYRFVKTFPVLSDFPDVPSVSPLCIFRAVVAVAVCDCSWVLYSGWNRVCGDWSGAEVPDTDRLWICRISCITVPVCGPYPA